VKGPDTELSTGDAEAAAFRRSELQAFLRARRRELRPQAVGLPARRRWRAPGLRMQDVAELAQLSTSRYTSIELGSATNVTPKTIEAIAAALRLDDIQTAHLYCLTGTPQPAHPLPAPATAGASLRRVVEKHTEGPALLVDDGFDILTANEAAYRLTLAAGTGGREGNFMWRMFMVATCRQLCAPQHDRHFVHLIGILRRAYAGGVTGGRVEELIRALRAECADFARLWNEQTVADSRSKRITFTLPNGSAVNFETVILGNIEGPRACFFVPLEATDSATLARYVATPAEESRSGEQRRPTRAATSSVGRRPR
jgi:transcriptional regulator with XRE-family HTH domain